MNCKTEAVQVPRRISLTGSSVAEWSPTRNPSLRILRINIQLIRTHENDVASKQIQNDS